jgi:3-oxoacyl-[acyl-carrier protein] reductase
MTILISGSTKGLGHQIAKALDDTGLDVWRHSRSKPRKSEILSNKVLHAELSSVEECRSIAEHFIERKISLSGLICNAGSGQSVPMGTEKASDWQKSFSDNFYSAVNLIQQLEGQVLQPGAKVVVIGSICGSNYIAGAPVTYSCAKAALETFVNHYAAHLARKGIQITYLELGNMLFEGSTWESKSKQDPNAVNEMLRAKVPLRTLGKAESIIGFIKWFLSDENMFATGSKYTIDGGQTI